MISIITPNFNRAYIIEETAESILNQTNDNWEWVIVDDGSTDASWETLKSYQARDSRIRVFKRNREPKGACTCRNIGVEKARGTHLMFVDSDDLISPNCIGQRLKWITLNESKILPFADSIIFQDSPAVGMIWDDVRHPVSWLTGLFTSSPACQGSAPLWAKQPFVDLGGWREDLNVWQDIELHIRAYSRGYRFEKVPTAHPDVFLRISPDSISRVDFFSEPKMQSRLTVIQSVMEWFEPEDFTESEQNGFQHMIMGVFEHTLNLRKWNLAQSIGENCEGLNFLTKSQRRWMQTKTTLHKLRLHRLPLIGPCIENKTKKLFGVNHPRELGSIEWQGDHE